MKKLLIGAVACLLLCVVFYFVASSGAADAVEGYQSTLSFSTSNASVYSWVTIATYAHHQEETKGRALVGGSYPYIWPVECTNISSKFGMRLHPTDGVWKHHNGVDISGKTGDEIVATAPGTVTFAGWDSTGGGNLVQVDHGEGVSTVYMHMSTIAATVGQTVDAGELIGYVGNTGKSTGPHLHFRVWVNGVGVDPMAYSYAGHKPEDFTFQWGSYYV